MVRREKREIFRIVLLFVICFISLPVSGKTETKRGDVESLDGLVKYIYRDTKHVLTAPLHWKQNDMVLFTTLSIGIFELMLMDKDLQEAVQRNRTIDTDRISKWTDRYTKRIANLTMGGLYLSGLVWHNRKSKETALLCLESVALAEGITISLKHIAGRARPFADRGPFHFDPLKFPPPSYSQSCPSGHATAAFALSSVIAEQYRSWVVRLLSYGFAVMVSSGRVNNHAHFISDVFGGGVIGTAVGRCLVKVHKKDCPSPNFEFISSGDKNSWKMGVLFWVN